MYAARRAGMKREMFGHVAGGYARVLARFAEVLAAAGVEIRTGFRGRAGRRAGAGLEVAGEHGALAFDRVVVTAPAPLAAALCPDLTEPERERLAGDPLTRGIVCASLLLRRPLAGFYDHQPRRRRAAVHRGHRDDRAGRPGELRRALARLPARHAAGDDRGVGWSDGEVRERFVAALARGYPGRPGHGRGVPGGACPPRLRDPHAALLARGAAARHLGAGPVTWSTARRSSTAPSTSTRP